MSPRTIKISMIIVGQMWFQSLSAQTIKGKLYNDKDSSAVEFITIVSVDSSEKILNGATSDRNGEFQIKLPNQTNYLKIMGGVEYSEIKIIGFDNYKKNDTLYNIGSIPVIQAPQFIQVQFKGISKRRERKNQEYIIEDYNNKVLSYKDIEVSRPQGNFKMLQKPEKARNNSNRLKLVYYISLNELIANQN